MFSFLSCTQHVIQGVEIKTVNCLLTDHIFYRCCTVTSNEVCVKWYHGNTTVLSLEKREQCHDNIRLYRSNRKPLFFAELSRVVDAVD